MFASCSSWRYNKKLGNERSNCGLSVHNPRVTEGLLKPTVNIKHDKINTDDVQVYSK